VAVHAHAVAEPVREERAESACGDELARGAIQVLAGGQQRACELHGGGLGVVHQVEHLAELRRRRRPEPDVRVTSDA
jgi:hypothetical protein